MGSRRRGLFSILLDTAYGVVNFSSKTLKKIISGDQSRATVRTSNWSRVIVRLDLYVEEGQPPAYGTGFFLNIPGSKYDVIVTTGHNLIQLGRDGPRVTQKIGIRLTDPETSVPYTKFVTPDSYKISTPYQISPGPTADSADDYGVILLDRLGIDGTPRPPRDAFGFHIVLATMDLTGDEPGSKLSAHVGGYPGIHQTSNLDTPPEFEFGTGDFGKYADRHLYYHGGTDQGMSGGPVWVNYLGEEVVVGIHNKHQEIQGEGNRGARLGFEVMQNICKWAGVSGGLVQRAVRAHPDVQIHSGLPPDGYFIQCMLQSDKPDCEEPLCYAWSGPIRDPTLTTFDIMPAQSSPTYSHSNNTFYIITSTGLNGPRRFCEFYTDPTYTPRQVSLSEKPTLVTLVKLSPAGTPKKGEPVDPRFNPGRGPFKVTMSQNHDTERLPKNEPPPEFKLTLWSEDIPPTSDPFGLERARLGLIVRPQGYKAKPPCDFEDFILE